MRAGGSLRGQTSLAIRSTTSKSRLRPCDAISAAVGNFVSSCSSSHSLHRLLLLSGDGWWR
jgi:hypothetical protein